MKAGELLMCALAWDKDARLVGNITAHQVAVVAAVALDANNDACPKCGSEPTCNIDCEVCNVVADLLENR